MLVEKFMHVVDQCEIQAEGTEEIDVRRMINEFIHWKNQLSKALFPAKQGGTLTSS